MSDQTPIEKAIEALKDAVDRIDNMVCAIDSGIHESELHDTAGDINDALAAIAAHVEAQLAEKDALIQRVVDYWDKWQGKGCIEADMEFDDIVTDMNKAGFKSTSSSDELRNPE